MGYAENFLRMMIGGPREEYLANPMLGQRAGQNPDPACRS